MNACNQNFRINPLSPVSPSRSEKQTTRHWCLPNKHLSGSRDVSPAYKQSPFPSVSITHWPQWPAGDFAIYSSVKLPHWNHWKPWKCKRKKAPRSLKSGKASSPFRKTSPDGPGLVVNNCPLYLMLSFSWALQNNTYADQANHWNKARWYSSDEGIIRNLFIPRSPWQASFLQRRSHSFLTPKSLPDAQRRLTKAICNLQPEREAKNRSATSHWSPYINSCVCLSDIHRKCSDSLKMRDGFASSGEDMVLCVCTASGKRWNGRGTEFDK